MKYALISLSIFALAARAEVLNTSNRKVSLLEFTVDASATELRKSVHCSESEIKAGLVNLVSFAADQDNSVREFKPTYHPLQNEGAWLIDNHKCSGLTPYLNGIGLDAYDALTGDATIFLAAFQQKQPDPEEWRRAGDNGYSKMRLFFQPDFDVKNVLKFPATCALAYPSLSSKIGLGDPELVCTLGEAKGQIRFAVRNR